MKNSEFSSHPLFAKLAQLESRLQSDEAIEKLDTENLDFYRSTCKYIRSQLDKSITVLILPNDLNEIHNLLDNILAQFNAYLGSGNVGNLNNMEAYAYPAIKIARNIPVPNIDDGYSYSAIVNDLKTLSAEKIAYVDGLVDGVKMRIGNVEQDVIKRESEIQAVSKSIADKQTQIDALNQGFQTNFDLIKSTESTKFEELRERLKTDLESKSKNIDESTQALIGRLNTKENEARKLVNVIGNIGATGNYQAVAQSHAKVANQWRIIALVFMASLSGIIIWTLFDVSAAQYDWKMALIRILSALVLTYPATYAARESAKHRKLENLNRKAELELASINPFIEILSDDKKQLIKEKLVEKYFGNNEGYIENDHSEDTHSVPFKVLDKVVDIFKEVKKS